MSSLLIPLRREPFGTAELTMKSCSTLAGAHPVLIKRPFMLWGRLGQGSPLPLTLEMRANFEQCTWACWHVPFYLCKEQSLLWNVVEITHHRRHTLWAQELAARVFLPTSCREGRNLVPSYHLTSSFQWERGHPRDRQEGGTARPSAPWSSSARNNGNMTCATEAIFKFLGAT